LDRKIKFYHGGYGSSLLSEISEQVQPMIIENFFNRSNGNVAQVLHITTNEHNGMF